MLQKLLFHPYFIALLFIVNLVGTIYGYFWYGNQLVDAPVYFLPFVPDSPTASLFFTLFLFFILRGKHVPIIEALAFTTLVKYGIWAVVMNLLTLYISGDLSWQGYMLIASHGAMAVQAFLYAPLYKFKLSHLAIAAIWLLHNELIDYVYDMMPVYGSLSDYQQHIGYFTFWLSIITIFIVYHISVKKNLKYTIT
ncbi:Uncharacterized membrane protein YpjA [Gracilibacillus orientalis]|uniref:Uncharacterized membrane protein YpjA n=1 Tax=Gracilibacillus orientalis TaxID=334253 RepID=A0A1I4L3D9_9BACI|nr:DUF1405 domain-containing protein [Gracilibacillus orientalis]SFL85323.1 Uncharacterized membrane protein YpjA [Gracilibacillus orientalis]